jgi:hypothetical protein
MLLWWSPLWWWLYESLILLTFRDTVIWAPYCIFCIAVGIACQLLFSFIIFHTPFCNDGLTKQNCTRLLSTVSPIQECHVHLSQLWCKCWAVVIQEKYSIWEAEYFSF